MKKFATALGGTLLGGAIGWFLPRVLESGRGEWGFWVLQVHGAGVGGLLGLILGGGLPFRGAGEK